MKRWLDPTDRRTLTWCGCILSAMYYATGEQGTAVALFFIAILAADDVP